MGKEKQHSVKLEVKDLAKKTICDGHLYLTTGPRKFYLMKPGTFVDPDFIKKHAINNSVFDFEPVVDENVKSMFKKHFRELRSLQFERDLRLKCHEITKLFSVSFSNDIHFLTFAQACYDEFCNVPIQLQKKIHSTDVNLFRKSFYSAAFAILTGQTNDFYHFLMLKDFYNISFMLDIGLCEVDYSYFIAEACNAESKASGSGIKYLESERASMMEKEVYFGHPEKSYEIIKNLNVLTYSELVESVLYQHELADGSGFPRGITKSYVSSWEEVILFSNSLVEIVPNHDFEKNTLNYLLSFDQARINNVPLNKASNKMLLALKNIENLEETGT